ncbi:MAG: hypothetical protein VW455_09725 [Nitrospinota bacterium]
MENYHNASPITPAIFEHRNPLTKTIEGKKKNRQTNGKIKRESRLKNPLMTHP